MKITSEHSEPTPVVPYTTPERHDSCLSWMVEKNVDSLECLEIENPWDNNERKEWPNGESTLRQMSPTFAKSKNPLKSDKVTFGVGTDRDSPNYPGVCDFGHTALLF